MPQQEEILTMMEKIIRAWSEAGRLIQSEEVLSELQGIGLLKPQDLDGTIDCAAMFQRVLHENQDLREICGRDGTAFYYSVQHLTEFYAGILVWKSENPLRLVAQVVRDNSRRYPRPVSADSFREPPFELTREEIAEWLGVMASEGEYQDIAQTTTTIGTAFLYSTRHLDPDHAAMLAEWLDVGQANNP